ncbi:MAG: hypothetical protein FWD61_03355 [Phycisphaerales bacterium]|nr:hypothetical protein [Phycisphaerales bacterium]
MAIDGRKLVPRIKAELQISGNADDPRIALLADEAIFNLQRLLKKTFVEVVTDPKTEKIMNPNHFRYITIYVAMRYDNDEKLLGALGWIFEQVRYDND